MNLTSIPTHGLILHVGDYIIMFLNSKFLSILCNCANEEWTWFVRSCKTKALDLRIYVTTTLNLDILHHVFNTTTNISNIKTIYLAFVFLTLIEWIALGPRPTAIGSGGGGGYNIYFENICSQTFHLMHKITKIPWSKRRLHLELSYSFL